MKNKSKNKRDFELRRQVIVHNCNFLFDISVCGLQFKLESSVVIPRYFASQTSTVTTLTVRLMYL